MIHYSDLNTVPLHKLLAVYGLAVRLVSDAAPIPGSHWGAPEAGLIGNRLYVRNDTPLHSVLHEACHYICMSPERRSTLNTNAGGDDLEEAAVCYLQLLLAESLPGVGRERLAEDMDAWGYSYRLGSTMAWFEEDAEDAFEWLMQAELVDSEERLKFPSTVPPPSVSQSGDDERDGLSCARYPQVGFTPENGRR